MSQNPDRRRDQEALLQGAEQQVWSVLVGAVRRIARGERSPAVFAGLDEKDHVIAESILRGLQDPATLPDPAKAQDASLAAPGLATRSTPRPAATPNPSSSSATWPIR